MEEEEADDEDQSDCRFDEQAFVFDRIFRLQIFQSGDVGFLGN